LHSFTVVCLSLSFSLPPLSLSSVLLKELLSLYLVLPISRNSSVRFISSRMHRPRYCAAEAPWFLIIFQIKVRFILSFFFTATNSSRETRQYAQSREMLAARSGKRQPDEFASERPRLVPMSRILFSRDLYIHRHSEGFSVSVSKYIAVEYCIKSTYIKFFHELSRHKE